MRLRPRPAHAAPSDSATRGSPGWQSLPGIQRVIGSIAPVADRDRFAASLDSHHDTRFLAPLAHLIDPDGPSGRISGLITPTPVAQRIADGPPAGVLRRWPQPGSAGPRLTASADGPAPIRSDPVPDEPTVQRPVAGPVRAGDVEMPAQQAFASPPASPMLQRSMLTAAPPTPVFRELPTVPTPEPTSAAVPPIEAAEPEPPADEPAPLTSQGIVLDQGRGDGSTRIEPEQAVPVQRTVQALSEQRRQPGRAAAAVQRASAASDPAAASPGSRPLGLGAPIERVPMTAAPVETMSVQEWAAARDEPAANAPTLAQRAVEVPATGAATVQSVQEATEATPHVDAPTAEPALAQRRVAEPALVQRHAAEPAAITATAVQPNVVQRSVVESAAVEPHLAEPNGLELAALLGDRDDPTRVVSRPEPVQTELSVDRPAPPIFDTPPRETPTTSGRSASTSPPRQPSRMVQRTPDQPPPAERTPAELAPAERLPAGRTAPDPARRPVHQRLVGDQGGIPLQTAATASAPTPRVEPERTWSVQPQAVQQQAQQPAQWTAAVQRTASAEPALLARPALPDAGTAAVAAGIAQRAADGSVVFPGPAASTSQPQRETTTPRHGVDTDRPALQRAVDTDHVVAETATPTAETATPTAETATSAAAPATPAAAPAQSPNLDELARRLYDPLAARIKAELRLDRERFGVVTDLVRP